MLRGRLHLRRRWRRALSLRMSTEGDVALLQKSMALHSSAVDLKFIATAGLSGDRCSGSSAVVGMTVVDVGDSSATAGLADVGC